MPAIDLIYTTQNDWIQTAATSLNETNWLKPSPDPQDPHLISLIFKFSATVGGANPVVIGPLTNAINRFYLKVDGKDVIDYVNPAPDADSPQLVSALDMIMHHAGGSSIMQQCDVDAQTTFVQYMEMPLGYAFNGNNAPQFQLLVDTLAGGGAAGWANNGSTTIASGAGTLEVWGRYGVAEDSICYGNFQKTPQSFSQSEQQPVIVSPLPDYDMLGVVIANATGLGAGESNPAWIDSIQVRNGSSTLMNQSMLQFVNKDWSEPYVVLNTSGAGPTSAPVLLTQANGLTYWNLYGVKAGVPVTFNVKKDATDSSSYFFFAPIFGRPLSGYGAQAMPTKYQDVGQPEKAAVIDSNVGGAGVTTGLKSGSLKSNGRYGRKKIKKC